MLDDKLRQIIEENPFPLNAKQESFLEKFVEGEGSWVLNGLAGSGKSVMMALLKEYYEDSIVFFASSGVANLSLPNNIGNGTGHSGLSLSLKLATELNYKKVSPKCSAIFGKSDLVRVVVIDECYGYNSDNLDLIWRRIKRFNKKQGKRQRRNIRLLMVGDPAQQVTITDENLKRQLKERWGHHLMFKSKVWERFNFTYAVFDKVERQDDKVFKACLDVIRYYQKERFPKCLAWLNKRVSRNLPDNCLVLSATNKTVDKKNLEVLERNPNQKFTFYGTISGDFNMKDLLVKENITVCEGLRVMTINNDQEGRWVNGSVGTVISVLYGESVQIRFDNGEEHYVEPYTWENKETYVEKDVVQDDGTKRDVLKEKHLGSFTNIPIVQASAFSISKSQGLTITTPFVIDPEWTGLYTSDFMGDFGTNFIYVALSRSSSIDNITLSRPIEPAHIKPCLESIEFWKETCEKSVI